MENKEMEWGMNSSHIMHTSKLDKYMVLDTVFKLDRPKSKDKEYVAVKINSMIWTQCTFFLDLCQVLKTWFGLSRVNLYRNDQKGNKNYFELAGGSSYQGFE